MQRVRSIALMAIAVGCGAVTTASATERNVMFILDGSGSMWGQIDARPKIAIAKDVLAGLIRELPDNIRAGLEVYGHRREADCTDIEVVSAVGKDSRTQLIAAMRGVQPKGKTPLTESLMVAARELSAQDQPAMVVLISDGKESCNADPCAAVRALKDAGASLTVHSVGFGVAGDEAQQLQCIAEAGGGQYFAANDANELSGALSAVGEKIAVSQPPEPASSMLILNSEDNIVVLDQATGDRVWVQRADATEAKPLPSGSYMLKASNLELNNIDLAPGENKVIDLADYFGTLLVTGSPRNVVIENPNSGLRAWVQRPDVTKPKQLAAGAYRIKSGNLTLDTVVVSARENKRIDIADHLGTLLVTGSALDVVVEDQNTKNRVTLQRATDSKAVPLAVGMYRIRVGNLRLEGIQVEGRKETRFDVSGHVGTLLVTGADEHVAIYDQATRHRVWLQNHDARQGRQYAVGRYRISSPGREEQIVDVTPGADLRIALRRSVD